MTATTQETVTASLIAQYSTEWHAATHHGFLDGVADGSLATQVWDRWLAQDYLFVADLLSFQANLLARAPRPSQAVLAAGLVTLEAELSWFEAHATKRGLRLQVARQATTTRYRTLLVALQTAPYPVAITGLWAIERAYLDAWLGSRPGAVAYREFVEHWTVSAFGEYVAGLQRAADLALRTSSAEVCAQANVAFLDVAGMEREFWEMAWSEHTT
ncbi:MAG: TenA family transcriptional regulator [Chloroflexota bacterium]